MNIRVQGPDGVVIEFPAGTDQGVITGVMQQRYGAPQAQAGGFNQKEAYERLTAGQASGADRIRPLLQGLTFGAGDEAVAGMSALAQKAISGRPLSEGYSAALAEEREALERARKSYPIQSAGMEIGGSVAGGLGLAGAGATTARMLSPTSGLGARMLAGGADAAALGAIGGFASGEGGENRVREAIKDGLIGGGVGATMPVAGAILGKVTEPIRNAISARLNPQAFAERQVAATVREAGSTPQQVEAALARAAQQGQGVYTAADELGDIGARQLGVAYRGPGEAANMIKNTLTGRQEGQARRIINQLEEGFQAPQTKAQLEAAEKAARRAEANALYGSARQQAGAVDPSAALAEADAILTPGASRLLNPGSGIQPGERVSAVARARAFLTDNKSLISDFDGALAAKQEMDTMIESASPKVAEALKPIRNALDAALEKASPPYAQARDAYRTASKNIEAIQTGTDAARRGRTADTIPAFQGMSAGEQPGFRAGYADDLIRTIEGMPAGADKSRMFTSEALRREVPAFAEPSRAQTLMDQLAREQRMVETARQAVGNSATAMRTADDAAAAIGPDAIASIARGNFLTPIMQTLSARGLGGNTPEVRKAIAELLLSTGQNAPQNMANVASRMSKDDAKALIRAMLASGATAGGTSGIMRE